jgi:hypothetical protein
VELNNKVVVTDVRMSFRSMVAFMVKWALASIPAAVILCGGTATVVIGGGGVLSSIFDTLRSSFHN